MKNGQLKAGYNLQLATENQFVLHYDVFPNQADTKTLLPFFETYPHDLKIVVADAGYGSEENLLRLDESNVNHLMKYAMFDKEQKKRDKQSARTWQTGTMMTKRIAIHILTGGAIVFIISNTRKHRRALNKKSKSTTLMILNQLLKRDAILMNAINS